MAASLYLLLLVALVAAATGGLTLALALTFRVWTFRGVFKRLTEELKSAYGIGSGYGEYLVDLSRTLGGKLVTTPDGARQWTWADMPMQLSRPGDYIELTLTTPLPAEFGFASQGGERGADTVTGDATFDSRVAVRGGNVALARLDAVGRDRIARLVELGASVENGRFDLRALRVDDAKTALATLLELVGRPAVALSHLASTDPSADVRLTALAACLEAGADPQHGAAEADIRHTLEDADERVRFLAALSFPSKRESALAIVSATSAAAMLKRMPPRAAAVGLRYLGACGAAAEPHLLAALDTPELIAVHATHSALLDALCTAGTSASVEVLMRRGYRTHAKEIQSRLPHAEAGQISIADGMDTGALSMTEERGALSLPKKQTT